MMSLLALATPRRKMPLLRRSAATAVVRAAAAATCGRRVPAQTRRLTTSPDMLALAQGNFKKWNDAIQTKDPKAVASLYCAKELSFLPTISPRHIKDADGTQQYFVDFVQKNPVGGITDESVQVYDGGNTYLHSGLYTFQLGDPGARTSVEARFSYVWRKLDGEWKISHHHSSVSPT